MNDDEMMDIETLDPEVLIIEEIQRLMKEVVDVDQMAAPARQKVWSMIHGNNEEDDLSEESFNKLRELCDLLQMCDCVQSVDFHRLGELYAELKDIDAF